VIVACGFDHAGYPLRETVFGALRDAGHEPLDLGTDSPEPGDDYPDYALAVARAISGGEAERGILCCGSGAGVAVAATKVPGIRAVTTEDTYTAHQSVEHDDVNVLALGARVIGVEVAAELVRAFAGAEFTGEERHVRRLAKVAAIERDGLEAILDETKEG
jgi:ribose 5-phosphate isomerase B